MQSLSFTGPFRSRQLTSVASSRFSFSGHQQAHLIVTLPASRLATRSMERTAAPRGSQEQSCGRRVVKKSGYREVEKRTGRVEGLKVSSGGVKRQSWMCAREEWRGEAELEVRSGGVMWCCFLCSLLCGSLRCVVVILRLSMLPFVRPVVESHALEASTGSRLKYASPHQGRTLKHRVVSSISINHSEAVNASTHGARRAGGRLPMSIGTLSW